MGRLRLPRSWLRTGVRLRRLAGRTGLPLRLGLVDPPDHVERALGVVLEFVTQNALTSVERLFERNELALESSEPLGREERLGEEALQTASARHHRAILGRELLEPEHGNDVLQVPVLGQRSPYFLRQAVVPLSDDARRRHFGARLKRIDRRIQSLAR